MDYHEMIHLINFLKRKNNFTFAKLEKKTSISAVALYGIFSGKQCQLDTFLKLLEPFNLEITLEESR